jgi:hypothetical protein
MDIRKYRGVDVIVCFLGFSGFHQLEVHDIDIRHKYVNTS